MKRTVITAALLAAFAMPAFAEDPMIKTDDSASMSTVDKTTTASTAKQTDMAPTAMKSGMDGGCMHRKNTALNMM
ncbi:MAG: hypothetical protein JWM58_1127 [Rhizobium sp.]|nr:hypothetical protein [Rhizobium sp.]